MPSNYAALNELQASLQIAPNPIVSQLKISGLTGQIADLTIYTTSGKKLMTLNLSDSFEEMVDVSGLERGVFIFSFKLEDGQVLNRKMVKA
jgi:hypothetical protein